LTYILKCCYQKLWLPTEKNKTPGYKRSKTQGMIFASCNAFSNHKLKLFYWRIYKKSAFENTAPAVLPVLYHSQKCPLIKSKTFQSWRFNEFVPLVESFF
jgi:hypothetical protein